MPKNDVTVSVVFADPAQFSVNDAGTVYTIHTAAGWDVFCDLLEKNAKGYFTGKTVKLDADISVTRMAGSERHDFTGVFDGQNHTLTFAYTATENYAAPFRFVEGASENAPAVIQNLNVNSTVSGTNCRHLSGLIGWAGNDVKVNNCNVAVQITSNQSSDSDLYPSGLVTHSAGTGLSITGCTVTGEITTNGK